MNSCVPPQALYLHRYFKHLFNLGVTLGVILYLLHAVHGLIKRGPVRNKLADRVHVGKGDIHDPAHVPHRAF